MSRKIEFICPFVPEELIAACGFEPCRKQLSGVAAQDESTGSQAGKSAKSHFNFSAGLCPIAESMLCEFADTEAAGVVFSTTCDQMRRAHEVFTERRPDVPAFLLNVPASWQGRACANYYKSELERLTGFLGSIGGVKLEDKTLVDTMRVYAKQRKSKCNAQYVSDSGINLGLVSCELRAADDWIYDYLAEFGGNVALRATCSGEMLTPDFNLPDDLDADPIGTLAEIYFAQPHPHQRPDSRFFNYISTQVVERKIKGIVFIRMSWCDTMHGLSRRLRQSLEIPMIEIAQAEQPTAHAHMQSRLAAFGEMLHE